MLSSLIIFIVLVSFYTHQIGTVNINALLKIISGPDDQAGFRMRETNQKNYYSRWE